MQKIYLLLRSNKQTGPYTLEELLQLNLKPFDLVWVDGRSAAWQYPFEIPALKPYVPETPHASMPFQPIATSAMEQKVSQSINPITQKTEAPKKVFVSIPKSYAPVNEQKAFTDHEAFMPPVEKPPYEAKAEASPATPSYRQHSASSQPKAIEGETVHTGYSRSLNDVEEDYTNWMYRQKTKKKSSINAKDLILTALILIVIGGGYYVMSKPSITNSVLPSAKIAKPSSVQPMGNTVTDAGQNIETVSNQNASVSANQTLVSNTSNIQPDHTNKNIKKKNPVIVSKAQTNSSVPSSQNSMPVEKTTPNIPTNNDVVSKEPAVKQQSKVENAPEKKKKIADVLKGIFSKKDKKAEETKNDPVVLDDPKPATNRQATRRDDNSPNNTSGAAEINTTALMNQIDISSNAPDNWMMGVRNLKITLRNRSNVAIQTASVTVNYYDENDRLLEKKLIYFANVAAKGKATVAAPDQKWADHVDFTVTSASAKDDRFASN